MADLASEFNNKEGWEPVNLDIDGWWRADKGATFKGQILGIKVVKDKRTEQPRVIYVMRSAFPVKAIVDGDLVELPAGSTIGFSETAALKGLRAYVTHRGLVMLQCLDKVKVPRGEMWRYKIVAKGKKAPVDITAAELPAPPNESDSSVEEEEQLSIDNIPF